MDYGVQLGRRFRALKLWMVLRAFGAEGLAARIREHCALGAAVRARGSTRDPDWESLAPVPFCTRLLPARPPGLADEAGLGRLNAGLLEAVNASGEAFLSHAVLDGRYALRLAIGNIRTEERHVRRAWEVVRSRRNADERGKGRMNTDPRR